MPLLVRNITKMGRSDVVNLIFQKSSGYFSLFYKCKLPCFLLYSASISKVSILYDLSYKMTCQYNK